jgi:hypothetical protein
VLYLYYSSQNKNAVKKTEKMRVEGKVKEKKKEAGSSAPEMGEMGFS